MKCKTWLRVYLLTCTIMISAICFITAYIDPYMHFHKPLTNKYFYGLYMWSERTVNDGISRNFDYDAIITGTSMIENTKTSEIDSIFNVKSIKIPYSGARFKEINDNLERAFQTHDNIKMIIRSLDRYSFLVDADTARDDMGTYPSYLYNNNPFDDINYLMNRSVVYQHIYSMLKNANRDGVEPGVTSFDEYANWMSGAHFGVKSIIKDYEKYFITPQETKAFLSQFDEGLTDNEKKMLVKNIEQNIINIVEKNPNTEFYCFIPVYSALYWAKQIKEGTFEKQIEAEKMIVEMLLKYDNIYVFGWDDFYDITTDLNHYKDDGHYGEWINTWILYQMKENVGIYTLDNYEERIRAKRDYYQSFDYSSLIFQNDYEDDYYAAELLNSSISGTN